MILDLKMNKPMMDILPKKWKEELNTDKLHNVMFRNLQHFKNYVSKVTQKENMKCGVSYSEALDDLLKEKSQYSAQEYESIRNLVRQNLLKRGLITSDVYERYKYNYEGQVIDVSELATGNPECVLTPAYEYKNHFYELYISISYPWRVSDETVRNNAIKLLATIEELERQHIFIKVTLVFGDHHANYKDDLLVTIPLFSYKDFKSIETMSAVVNERQLRKYMFALLEDVYGNELSSSYGIALDMTTVINIGNDLNEIDLFTSIVDQVVTPGTR